MNRGSVIPPGWSKDEKTKTGKCVQCGEKIKGSMWSCKCPDYGCRICSKCVEKHPEKRQYDIDAAEWQLWVSGCWSCHFDGGIDPKFAQTHPRPPPIKRTEEEIRARISKGLPPFSTSTSTKARKQNGRSAPSMRNAASPGPAGAMAPVEPNDDFEAPQIFTPTIATEKPRRSGLKRKNYDEGGFDDDVFVDGPHGSGKAAKRPALFINDRSDSSEDVGLMSHLHGGTTVIVGAGVVGLCIARELAMETNRVGLKHHIVVVEIRESYCELASGHCAGFLSTRGMLEDWQPLVEEAKHWWHDIIGNPEHRERLQFSTAFKVTEGGSTSRHKVPSWLRQDAGLSLSEDTNAVARIYSGLFADWLYSDCEDRCVDFRFNHCVSNVDIAADGTLSGVQVRRTDAAKETATDLPCSNLVLAAGPFTTHIFKKHFADTPLKLKNYVQRSHWFRVNMAEGGMDENDTALGFPDAAESERLLEHEIRMVPNVSQNVLVVSGTTAQLESTDLTSSLARESGRSHTRELRGIAATYLDAARVDVKDKSNIVESGRSELSVAHGMRPVIDRVLASSIRKDATVLHPGGVSSGVWLCYGFGKHGTMVAPGAAKILVSKMFSKQSEAVSVDDRFGIPVYVNPQGLGKGKAKKSAW